MQYRLNYMQPYEVDEDSPSGFGDHSIEFGRSCAEFVCENNVLAMQEVDKFLQQGMIQFVHHLDGDGKTYFRKKIDLWCLVQ